MCLNVTGHQLKIFTCQYMNLCGNHKPKAYITNTQKRERTPRNTQDSHQGKRFLFSWNKRK